MRIETLTSAQNPLLKAVRRAAHRGELTADGFCVAEGFHLLEEAIRSGCQIQRVIASESVSDPARLLSPEFVLTNIADSLFRELSTTETSQSVIALVRPPLWTFENVLCGDGVLVVLDGIQEPGNAGAIVRAAEAFRASGAVFLKGTVSPYNPKSLRASGGSLFRLPFVHNVEPGKLLAVLSGRGTPLFAAMPDGETPVHEADLSGLCAIVFGSEGHGVRPELAGQATSMRIPTRGVESLNAAVAAGVILYEAQRQRMLR